LRTQISTPIPSDDYDDLRLPLELILHIIDLAVFSSPDKASRERLHLRLRGVNRTFAVLFARRRFHTLALGGGEDLSELIEQAKKDLDVAEGLEGIKLRNLIRHESRTKFERDWGKLVKVCRGLTYVELGDPGVRIKPGDGVHGHVVHAMHGAFLPFPLLFFGVRADLHLLAGITALRLVSLEVRASSPPRTLTNFFPSSTPLFPPSLRHLALSSVHVNIHSPATFATIWPDVKQLHLTSLCLSDLQCVYPNNGAVRTSDLITSDLLVRAAPSLRALHYSYRHRSLIDLETSLPPVVEGIDFSSLRILSLSLVHFSSSLFTNAPNLTHLFLTLRDTAESYPLISTRAHDVRTYKLLLDAFSAPSPSSPVDTDTPSSSAPTYATPVWPSLQVLELPARKHVRPSDEEQDGYWEAEETREEVLRVARERGVDAKRVYYLKEETGEERFRRALREVLKERV
jgi:hypothetical protein